MIELLEKLGLSKIEARVYDALIEIGPTFAAGIIAKTKQHRQQVYDALENLKAKSLVTISRKNGKQVFNPVNPEQLKILVREKEDVLKQVLPLLLQKFKQPQEEVILYNGADGYRQALENRVEAIKAGELVKVIGGTNKKFYNLTKEYYAEHIRSLNKKRSGNQWIIYEDTLKEFNTYFGQYLKHNCQARVLKGEQQTPVATVILQDRIQISLFYPDPTIIEIKNTSLAEEYTKHFQLLWEQSKDL